MSDYLGSDDEFPFSVFVEYNSSNDFNFSYNSWYTTRQTSYHLDEIDQDKIQDKYFTNILERVSAEENKTIALTKENEERLFDKISLFLKKPYTYLGIMTFQKLAYLPSSLSADRLKEIAKIICKHVFNPLSVSKDYTTVYADFCKAFAYLSGSTRQGEKITFEQILISEFLEELTKKFNYSQRLDLLLDSRDIPHDKKRNWLEKQMKEQQRVFKTITKKSVNFLNELFQLYPEIVYRVIEILVKSREEDAFQYLCVLLDGVRYHRTLFLKLYSSTNIHNMKLSHRNINQLRGRASLPELVKKESLTPLMTSITFYTNENHRISEKQKGIIQNELIDVNPLKENTPQDYIKYCLKDLYCNEPEDDFIIDDESEFDSSIITLTSKNFYSPRNLHYWRGLRVKILTKNPANCLDSKEENSMSLATLFQEMPS